MLLERSTDSDVGDSVSATVYIIGGVLGGVSVLILVMVVSRHCRHQQSANSGSIHQKSSGIGNNSTLDQTSTLLQNSTISTVINLEISPCSVQILRRIGNAQFGTVYIGNFVASPVASNPVIVKTLAWGADPLTREFFIARTRAMVGLKHGNILGLVGACLQPTGQSGIISALYEHYDGVDLNTLLHREKMLSWSPRQTEVLMKMAIDIACGLTYLCQNSITHGDVSSSNILVVMDAAGCPLVAKVCDVSLTSPWCSCVSHHLHDNCLFTPDSSGVLWPQPPPAPELLIYGHVAVTEATDVWQFGVVLQQIYNVIGHQHLVVIVTDCFNDEPARRPRLKDVHRRLQLEVTFDPVIDRVTGEVIRHCDLHTTSPATSNETGYSPLMAHPDDTNHKHKHGDDDDDGLTNQLQHPRRHGNGQLMSDEVNSSFRQYRRSTLPRSVSISHVSSQIVV